jgi:hypothetical protein
MDMRSVKSLLAALSIVTTAYGLPEVGVDAHFDQGWPLSVMPQIALWGFASIRDGITWANFETSKGVYAIPAYDQAWLNAAHANGLKVVLLLNEGNRLYSNNYDPAAYANAAAALAKQVKNYPAVEAIEILNEPNNDFQSYVGANWESAYVKLSNAAYAAIKAANPSMIVITGGAQGQENWDMLSMGLEGDGYTSHPYSPPLIIPETVYEPPNGNDSTLAGFVADWRSRTTKPLWFTEYGCNTEICSGSFAISNFSQAMYYDRRLLETLGLGVEHSFIYDFKDEGVPGNCDSYAPYGLWTANADNTLSDPKMSQLTITRILNVLNGLNPMPLGTVSASGAGFDTADFYGYAFGNSSETVAAVWLGNGYPAYGVPPGRGAAVARAASIRFPVPSGIQSVTAVDPLYATTEIVPATNWSVTGSDITVTGVSVGIAPTLVVASSSASGDPTPTPRPTPTPSPTPTPPPTPTPSPTPIDSIAQWERQFLSGYKTFSGTKNAVYVDPNYSPYFDASSFTGVFFDGTYASGVIKNSSAVSAVVYYAENHPATSGRITVAVSFAPSTVTVTNPITGSSTVLPSYDWSFYNGDAVILFNLQITGSPQVIRIE